MNINRKPWKEHFKDKVAIVTGGSSGIGRAITEELCKEGTSVEKSRQRRDCEYIEHIRLYCPD